MKMMGGESDKPSVQAPSPSPSTPRFTELFWDGQVIIHEKPHLPTFSGIGKHCSFGRWKYELKVLEADARYSTGMVLETVHRSLKTPAADALPTLVINPTLQQVIDKIESAYGYVLSGEALLERFYCERETVEKTCANWSQ